MEERLLEPSSWQLSAASLFFFFLNPAEREGSKVNHIAAFTEKNYFLKNSLAKNQTPPLTMGRVTPQEAAAWPGQGTRLPRGSRTQQTEQPGRDS